MKENSTFEIVDEIKLGPVKKWMSLSYGNTTYLITSSAEDNPLICETDQKPGNIWSFNGEHDKYGHVLSTSGFVDIIKANDTTSKYYTLRGDGGLYAWDIDSDLKFQERFLMNLTSGKV